MPSNTVMLNYQSNEFYVSDAGYEQIAMLVKQYKLCTYDYKDRHPYTQDNPCVGKNLCLRHFLERNPSFTLVTTTGEDSDGRMGYLFVDTKGYICRTREDSTEKADISILDTLTYHNFAYPEEVESRGKRGKFSSYYAKLYGDVRTASVLVMDYNDHYDRIKGLFLLYKDGGVREFSRKSDTFRNAEALVKQSQNKKDLFPKDDSDVFPVVSQLESAIYNVQLQYLPKPALVEEQPVENSQLT